MSAALRGQPMATLKSIRRNQSSEAARYLSTAPGIGSTRPTQCSQSVRARAAVLVISPKNVASDSHPSLGTILSLDSDLDGASILLAEVVQALGPYSMVSVRIQFRAAPRQ